MELNWNEVLTGEMLTFVLLGKAFYADPNPAWLRALAEDDLDGVCRGLFNSLEAPSIRKFPVLQLLKDAMRKSGAAGALMSGSGATVFGLFPDATSAERAAHQISAEFGPSMWTQTTRVRSA